MSSVGRGAEKPTPGPGVWVAMRPVSDRSHPYSDTIWSAAAETLARAHAASAGWDYGHLVLSAGAGCP